jgi:transposase
VVAREGLRGLRRRRAPGNPSKLSVEQKQALKAIVNAGAKQAGYPTERWTLKRLRQVIQQQFGVTYHVASIARVMHELEMTLQQPIGQASERDERLIRAWLSKDWPRIKKSAAEAAKHRIRG